MIEFVDLYKSFGRQQVLKGINLTIPHGQITAIIGQSGSGKSVLIKHLIGLIRPDSGQALVDGTDVVQLRGKALDRVREKFGVLFQGGALFDSMTLFDNVAFPLREKTRLAEAEIAERAMQRLEAVGLADMGHKYPAELSGGMKKRAALARALVQDPAIMLFDEPTTGLDPISGELHPPIDSRYPQAFRIHGDRGQPRYSGDLRHRPDGGVAARWGHCGVRKS